MTLPYARATTNSAKALGDMQKLLRGFGCTKFGNMVDDVAGELLVQFEHRGRQVTVRASMKGYAAAYLKKAPGTRTAAKERKALEVANVAVYSMLRDWIKGQITAIECGILTFEGAFLGQILLGSGQTVLEHLQQHDLLPAIEGPKA